MTAATWELVPVAQGLATCDYCGRRLPSFGWEGPRGDVICDGCR